MSSFLYRWALLAASICSVYAQTWTDCDPLVKTCPPNQALGTNTTFLFNKTLDDTVWNVTNGAVSFTSEGTEFTIKAEHESPTMQSNFFIFFGIVESHIKVAKGKGIISSVVLQSDDRDEIDWEWVGYNTSEVQSNYFGKGNDTTFDRGGTHSVPNADTEFHNYTTHWTAEKLEWWIDGKLIRTLMYNDALGGKNFPQTPCNIRYGIWPAGIKSNKAGVIEWAGGLVDYTAGPYTMVLQSARVHDFHTGKQYEYSDHSGSWESIKVVAGNSTVADAINNPPKSLAEKWADLPTGAKAGVYIGAAAFGALCIAGFVFFFIQQRKKGRLEHALEDTKWNTERTEMSTFQTDWKQSEWKHKGYQPVN
ncbi:glycoside hydrolase family 16 protein [Aspergillus clavatus NRRL 1]|uniref:chitinase n=1 Tax=Aspergillus clavatus (strain ATCC 1007 / CBS 513.65 / DSM 816 / NCTC 3887 / NRRL 1 / QM 1276 / 107) TaxID=344612 RepID=A1CK37_ASPCL|nr:Glycosyl hydrolases family 16, putative [Aspergillus clavatus NRRL 1]EAW09511.1 Glycosyl hydrolases family 16, putative [Aspergillus clavatus NRRL 1]